MSAPADLPIFHAAGPVDAAFLSGVLSGAAVLSAASAAESEALYLDTFDWRLFKRGKALRLADNELTLLGLSDGTELRQKVRGQPAFAWDLPAGKLSKQAAPLIEMRALLPRARQHTTSRLLRVLNEDQKTVLRLAVDATRAGEDGQDAGTFVRLLPVRGYEPIAAQVGDRLAQAGLDRLTLGDAFRLVMQAAGQRPGDYQAKPVVPLDPAMPAGEALKALLRAELDVIHINEPYIARDLDSEFLHDYRVALRRTRSALAEVKGVFAAEATARARADLQAANQVSNDLRDLDVYLLSEARYRTLLPAALQAAIGPLFTHLRERRSLALADTVAALESPRYRQIMARWEKFLAKPAAPAEDAREGGDPVVEVASRRIYKQYRRVLKDGRAITAGSEDASLHALRIECKKLRYLIELFGGLFEPAAVDDLVRSLRGLQNNLGDFNDLSVQEAYLMRTAGEMAAGGRTPAETLMAIGALVATLDRQRATVRTDFADAFAAFAERASRQRFKRAFGGAADEPADTEAAPD